VSLSVLLWSPLPGEDPPSGDVSYTEALLHEPPPGVVYTTQRQAIADGTVRIRGRTPWRGPVGGVDLGLLTARVLEREARRRGLLFREPIVYATIEGGAYDLVHQHLVTLRQVGSQVPVVSSAGYPLTELYRWRERWGPARLRLAEAAESRLVQALGAHSPWLATGPLGVMTVYTDHFRSWLRSRGVPADRIRLSGTAIPDLSLPPRRSDGRTLVVVARDFWRKGGDLAVQAFRHLYDADPAWRLVVVTTGASAEAHRRLLEHRSITVETGLGRDAVLRQVLPASDILLLPTRSDCGAPYGVLEALQAGVSVVTSDLAWLDERLRPPAVVRVPLRPDRIASAVVELAGQDDREEAARRLWLDEFSMPVLHRSLIDAYRHALAGRSSPPGHDADAAGRSAREAHPARVLVTARPEDFAETAYDGFVTRHRRMIRSLASSCEVSLLAVSDRSSRSVPGTTPLDGVRYGLLLRRARPAGRFGRLLDAVRQLVGIETDDDRRLVAEARRAAPDLVVTLGPWLGPEYRPLWRRYPAIHLVEEDLARMREIAPQSGRARLLRAVIGQLEARAPGQPMTVVTISPDELRRAEVAFPTAAHAYLPFTLDPDEWPVTTPSRASCADWVAVVGNYAEERNAEALAAVLEVVVERRLGEVLAFDVVSGPGLHPILSAAAGGVRLRHRRVDGPVRSAYDTAWAALVPASRVTGQKTTILQAWACGVPVVCSSQAAASVQADASCVAAGVTPAQLVELLVALRDDLPRREALVAGGATALARRFDPHLEAETLLRLLSAACLRWRSRCSQPT
jgi:glycosyltransferase involved in cell wall biosynthesis